MWIYDRVQCANPRHTEWKKKQHHKALKYLLWTRQGDTSIQNSSRAQRSDSSPLPVTVWSVKTCQYLTTKVKSKQISGGSGRAAGRESSGQHRWMEWFLYPVGKSNTAVCAGGSRGYSSQVNTNNQQHREEEVATGTYVFCVFCTNDWLMPLFAMRKFWKPNLVTSQKGIMARGIMCLGCEFVCHVPVNMMVTMMMMMSETPWGHFFKFGTNIHLESTD